MERKKKKIYAVEISYLFLVGDLPYLREWFTNLSSLCRKNLLILGTKYVFPYQGLIFRKVRDLETRKFVDKHLLCIFRLHYLSITNFPYEEGQPAGGLKTLDGLPCSWLLGRHPALIDGLSDSLV